MNVERALLKFFLAITPVLFVGCGGKEEIKVYSVPKEASQAAASSAMPASSHEDLHPIHWTTPPGWEELAPTSMRLGNFRITKGEKRAEVTIITFPGRVGTELENVNRWRGEIGLEPIEETAISSEPVVIGRGNGKLYEMAGPQFKTTAAILDKGDAKWFFKMRGDKDVVSEQKPAFVQLLKSITFHSDDDEPQVAAIEPPVSPNIEKIPEAESSGEPQWDVPASWQETPPTAMVFKSFSAGNTKISVTKFPGDVGGTLANVNRWRQQLSLEPIAQPQLAGLTTSIDVLGGKATLVDMKGIDAKTGKPARMIAATVPRGELTWFYKMMGDEATVAREKDAFVKFVQTVRY